MQLGLRAHDRQQAFVFPRLLHEVACPAAHGFHREFHIAPCGHYDDWKIAVSVHDFREKIEAFLAGCSVARVIQDRSVQHRRNPGERIANLGGRLDRCLRGSRADEAVVAVLRECAVDRPPPKCGEIAFRGNRKASGTEFLRLGRSRHEFIEMRW